MYFDHIYPLSLSPISLLLLSRPFFSPTSPPPTFGSILYSEFNEGSCMNMGAGCLLEHKQLISGYSNVCVKESAWRKALDGGGEKPL